MSLEEDVVKSDFFSYLSNNYNIILNQQQREAVTHDKGPALILAGPGAGKTTVLICRAAYLIKELGVNPNNILSVTYNRAAAMEMDQRFAKVFGQDIKSSIRFSTIHSLAYNVFMSYAKAHNIKFTLIEESQSPVSKKALIKDIYRQVNGEILNDDKLDGVISAIGYIKNTMTEDLSNQDYDIKNFEIVFEKYENIKAQNQYIDFDDMLTKCYEIFEHHPQILRTYQQRYKYVQIDEGQDNSKIQSKIINMLSKGSGNIYIVADDDQSIYGFRGAQPSYLLDFKNYYNDGKIYYLEQNYRSTQNIVEISSKFIKTNQNRFDKNHQTTNEKKHDPQIVTLKNDSMQLDYILDKVEELYRQDGGYREIAILFRNNLSALAVADLLERRSIPFYLKESSVNFINHWCVKDILDFLYHSQNPYESECFSRIYYKMNRYLSKTMIEYGLSIDTKDTFIEKVARHPQLQPFQKERLKETRIDFAILSGMEPREAIGYIVSVFEYDKFIQEFCKKFGYSYRYIKEMIANITLIAKGCSNIKEFLLRMDSMEHMLSQSKFNKKRDCVTLSTIHSAKGLEFKHVFVIDLIEEILPTSSSIEKLEEDIQGPMEEERRLFYVAITRPKENLYLMTYEMKNGERVMTSRFVHEIKSCMYQGLQEELRYGTIIHHKTFGKGTVLSSSKVNDKDSITLEIKFATGVKSLDLKSCIDRGLISY